MDGGLFRDRCPCGNSGIRPGGNICPEYPRCWVEDIIAHHRGRATAISIEQIDNVVKIGPREIKQAVHDLRLIGVRIGSSRRSGDGGAVAGYYMIETKEELRDFLRTYKAQIDTELRVVEAMLGYSLSSAAALSAQFAAELSEEPPSC